MGHLLPLKDFCKLHIVFHYTAVLLHDLKTNTHIYPIGAVGDDLSAEKLIEMMRKTGMYTDYVKTIPQVPTLHSICFQYPDHSGGNITESQSASSLVSPQMVLEAGDIIRINKSIVLSVPEVPLATRIELIKLGYKYQAFVMASFLCEEMETVIHQKVIEKINLLSINLDEAASLARISPNRPVREIVQSCIDAATRINSQIKLCITCGDHGIYGYSQGETKFIPAIEVPVRNTAGAGDAVLSGLVVGLVLGLPFSGDKKRTCLRLARLVGTMSVTSEDTINFDINLKNLRKFQETYGEDIL
jgi:sugar/nucleoside kinase (ribokinase family)